MIRLIECISFWGLLSNTYVVFLKGYNNDKLQVQTLKAYVSQCYFHGRSHPIKTIQKSVYLLVQSNFHGRPNPKTRQKSTIRYTDFLMVFMECCLPMKITLLLSGLYVMWSFMKITLILHSSRLNTLKQALTFILRRQNFFNRAKQAFCLLCRVKVAFKFFFC